MEYYQSDNAKTRKNIKFLLFGSYGDRVTSSALQTPVTIPITIGLEMVRFSDLEFKQYVGLFNQSIATEGFAVSDEAATTLYNLTLVEIAFELM